MKHGRFDISGAAAVIAAIMLYFFDFSVISAAAVPLLLHECAHIAVLRALGLKIKNLKISLSGLCITYSGPASPGEHAIAAAAGPLIGLMYSVVISRAAVFHSSDWLCLSSGISLIFSVFNLLPVFPLDGGAIYSYLVIILFGREDGMKIYLLTGIIIGSAMLILGIWLMFRGYGTALAIAAVWVLYFQPSGTNGRRSCDLPVYTV